MNIKKRTRGFTIVELLITVIVIGIISAIAVFGFGRIQIETRDRERAAAASTIMAALEKYYDENGEYPSSTAFTTSQKAIMTDSEYAAVTQAMPTLTRELLDHGNTYRFYAVYCASSSSAGQCADTNASHLRERSKQLVYISSRINALGLYPYGINENMHGCTITMRAGHTVGSAAVLAWRSEASGTWTFLEARRAPASPQDPVIAKNNSSSPTNCVFTAT